jgi:uncharacterized OsmC-like protein
VFVRADGRSLRLDMPELLGGSNRGMMPLEAVLAAYAGSMNVVGNFVAKTMDFELRGLEFTIAAELDPRGIWGLAPVRNPFPVLHVHAIVTTTEPPRRLALFRKRLAERCPVHNLLKKAGVRFQETWERVPPAGRATQSRKGASAKQSTGKKQQKE